MKNSEMMDGESGVNRPSKRRRCDDISDEEELSVKLSDKSILDCPICFCPLTIPVFQCSSGHIICSSCHGSLKPKKCPSCSVNLGNFRNRAIEKVLDSIKFSCLYKSSGCAAELTYSTKLSHEQTCAYSPYDCPFKDCNFLGPQPKLYLHLKNQHSSSVVLPRYPSSFNFQLCMSKCDEFAVLLKKENEGPIFILNLLTMGISSILEPGLSKVLRFDYTLTVRHKSGSFSSQRRDIRPWRDKGAVATTANSSEDLLPILEPFFDHDGRITLEIYVSYHYNH